MNETHNPALTSWVESANTPGTDFPIQNLPFGVFKLKGVDGAEDMAKVGIAIGDRILDVSHAATHGIFSGLAMEAAQCCHDGSLNRLMSMGRKASSALRSQISAFLSDKANTKYDHVLVPMP